VQEASFQRLKAGLSGVDWPAAETGISENILYVSGLRRCHNFSFFRPEAVFLRGGGTTEALTGRKRGLQECIKIQENAYPRRQQEKLFIPKNLPVKKIKPIFATDNEIT